MAADIDDPGAWQVYLDWLLEREDPRAELVRLQTAREDLDDDKERNVLDKQIYDLIDAHGEAWLAGVNKLDLDVGFAMARGVVGHVTGSPAKLALHADQILEAAPLLTSVTISLDREDRDLSPLAGSPLLARVRHLDLNGSDTLRVLGWGALDVPNLRALTLFEIALGPEDTEALLAAPRMAKLESLGISYCRLNKGALEPLARLRCPLRRIDLSAGHVGPKLGELLGRFRELASVRLPGNEIGSTGFAALAPALAKVTHLDLRGNDLRTGDLAALLKPRSQLTVLKLGGNLVGNKGAELVAAWPGARNLTHLDLGSADIGNRGALAIANSTQLSTKLRTLKLGNGAIAETTKHALLDAPQLANARIYVGFSMLARKAREAELAKAAKLAAKKAASKAKPAAKSKRAKS
jgi:uncharacterized protein (TIGR02996 family)